MMYDMNSNNFVSVDETMNMLYARYGRSRMELKLKELFGEEVSVVQINSSTINTNRSTSVC
jgi:hypothetical protein